MPHRLDYLLRKLLLSLLTLGAVLVFNFFLFRVIPGDPVEMIVSPRMRPETREYIRQAFGLDKPVWLNTERATETGHRLDLFDSQFFHYLANLARGQLGVSFRHHTAVSELIARRLGPTILLIVTGEFTGIALGTALGLVAAWKKRTALDTLTMLISLTLWALPAFLLGIVLLALAKGLPATVE